MIYLTYILFGCGLLYCVEAYCNDVATKFPSQRLREILLCGYDKTERPINSYNNQTKVYMAFFPKYLDFDDGNDYLQLATLVYMKWYDPNLQWIAKDYGELLNISIKAESIWVPDFEVSNSKMIHPDNLNNIGHSDMNIEDDGGVTYITSTLLSAHCTADWTNWPFDKHVCNFTLTSEKFFGSALDLVTENVIIYIIDTIFIHSNEWELLEYNSFQEKKYYSNEPNTTGSEYEMFLNLRFIIQRHSAVLAASYITPAIAFIALSLGLLLIEPTNSDRITVISLLILLQSLYLQYLAYKIPANGDATPKIVRFFVLNMFLSGILLLQTLIIGAMPTWTSKPTWLPNVSKRIALYPILQILLLPENDLKVKSELQKSAVDSAETNNEECVSLVVNDDAGQQWKTFADIMNRITFIILLMLHIIIIVTCLLI